MENTENKPKLKLRFHTKSFLLFLLIFVIEVLIALFVKDSIIRPYGGDVLVILMIYYFVKTFIKVQPTHLAIAVFIFACGIEIAQLFNLVEVLQLQDNNVMRIVIGTSFSWGDIVCYALGAVSCVFIEHRLIKLK
jgi:DNA integrity scanning protein DisA with diadenylate cyclase activity